MLKKWQHCVFEATECVLQEMLKWIHTPTFYYLTSYLKKILLNDNNYIHLYVHPSDNWSAELTCKLIIILALV